MNLQKVDEILEKHRDDQGSLIAILEGIQSKYGYLPEEALKKVSDETGHSFVDIYGIATFYKTFSLEPRGKHYCSVCVGTACHVREAPKIVEEFERQLDMKDGTTREDKEFTLESVACLGACALGPIVVVDGHYFSNVDSAEVKKIIDKTQAGLDNIDLEGDERAFPVLLSCPTCNHSLMDSSDLIDNLPSVRLTMSFDGKHGWLRLSSVYGSYNVESEYTIPEETIVNVFCPHCHTELISPLPCPECETETVSMSVQGGGMVQICSKKGCKGHMLDVTV